MTASDYCTRLAQLFSQQVKLFKLDALRLFFLGSLKLFFKEKS